MHAGGSDDNDQEVEVSVDDEKSDVSHQSDVKLEISEDLGKRKENEENIMEGKDNKDMKTGYDKDDKK